jgi:alkylhydroperoxidase family enzyme
MPSDDDATDGGRFFITLPTTDALAREGAPSRANVARVHDAHPGMSRRFYDLFLELMSRAGPLPRWQREMVATVVSSENGCHY